MASTLLATTAIMLSSPIAEMLMTSLSGSSTKPGAQAFVVGYRTNLGLSIKLFSILVRFMLDFLLNVQSIRYYTHTSILITVRLKRHRSPAHCLTADYVANTMNKGSYFWSTGIHAFLCLQKRIVLLLLQIDCQLQS
ncbi:uncharacterized protein LOC135625671 [Musa acuminata AAA Group]|uniref:uncharacterized protein LOC135625671 n=1 Tax=Musa acuminata AAA Group TaxID=214697 RepID=UPI0031D41F6C